jgi:putative tricarboxylic transport membrane protein
MGVDLSVVAEGLTHALTLHNLMWLVIGVTLGLVSGTLPGLGGGTMMAILLPIVTTLPIDTMLITLAAIYAANVYADSTTGILYNIPGGAAGIPASMEGYQLKLRGRLEEAFSAQVSGSFFGACVGFLVLLVLVPSFIYFVKFFGSAERALLAVWALVFIASGAITRDDPLRSFLSIGVGLALALVGQQPNIGTFRFTMGLESLWDGLKVVLLIMGLFAIPQLLDMSKLKGAFRTEDLGVERISFGSLYRSMGAVLWKGRDVVVRSSLFGVFIGVIPGIGTSTAAWIGYSVARSRSRLDDKFGQGNRDGVLGAESASNACEVGTIIPLLALGIPGSAAAAIMLAALNLVGINPGPSMYATHGAQVWTVMFGIGLSGIMFSLLAYPFIKGAQSLSRLPVSVLIASIGTLCIMGAYLETHNLFGPTVMIVLGVVMVFAMMIGLRPAPLLIGFVLGPGIEKELIRAYQIGGFERFLKPAASAVLVIIAITLAVAVYRRLKPQGDSAEDKLLELADAKQEEDDAAQKAASFLKDKLLAVLGIIFGTFLLITTLNYPLFASLWVYFVGGCFVIVPSLMLLASGGFSVSDKIALVRSSGAMSFDKSDAIKQAVIVGAFGLFVALINPLGFLLATALFTFAVVVYLDRNYVSAITAGIGVAAMIWGVKTLFTFYLPLGVLNL